MSLRKKAADKDFSINDLPQNRKEVFFDVIKIKFNSLLRCGLSLIICCIPLFLCVLFKSINIGSAQNLFKSREIDNDEFLFTVNVLTFVFDLGIILSSFIVSIGISGTTRVIRQLGWEEPLFYRRDFLDGVKKNYKYIYKLVLFIAVIYFLSDIITVSNINSNLLKVLPELILIFLFLPVVLYSITMVNIYNIKTLSAVKNSILLFFKTSLICILFSLSIFACKFISLLPNIVPIIIYVILLTIGLPLFYLAFFLYSSNVFDKYINAKSYPELVGKGTFPSKEN